MITHLDRLVAVAGEVLGGQSDDEPAPQSNGHTEEQMPVLDHPQGVSSEDVVEFAGQPVVADQEDGLQVS